MLTAAEIDELYSRVSGVRNDLTALIPLVPHGDSLLLVEGALANIYRAIELSAKLVAMMTFLCRS